MSGFLKYLLYLVVLLLLALFLAESIPFDRIFHDGAPSMIQVAPA